MENHILKVHDGERGIKLKKNAELKKNENK